ncbi:MAG TPA: ABC transporter substrate-binding protein [Flavobacteriaceae bacterium]|nr:ABC transporter substrate-binding protein [Flavobacteriaceae bacterium]
MFKKTVLLFIGFGLFSCQNNPKRSTTEILSQGDTLLVDYAKGFEIMEYDDFKLVTVKNAWPETEKKFTYLLAEKDAIVPGKLKYDEKITVPIDEIVVTSTTHIPSLERLGVAKTLVGFPTLDYISSEKTRALIEAGKIQELGSNQSLNTEILLELQPDVVVGFSVNGNNKAFQILQKSGIPVVYNSDWTEKNPLGKAEWIKFFGAFYNKLPEAKAAFQEIEKAYLQAKKLTKSANQKPTVLSGAMYRDRWYLPSGESWQAAFIKAAGGNYFYAETHGNGSLALSFEQVFQQAKDADIWIAPGNFTSYEQLLSSSEHYKKFKAFQAKKIYNYAGVTGATGGVLYYEFAPNRPDLVLKDLIKIFHPELLPDYELTFFKSLE